MLNNVPVVPIFAVPLNDNLTQFGIGNDDVQIGITAQDGHSAFVSGVAGSYSLPPARSQTSGLLALQRIYTIQTYVAGDNFVNVGGANVSGTVFQATGDTPTVWANGSTLTFAGNLTIFQGAPDTGQVFFSIDITQDGPFAIYFQRAASLRSEETLYFVLVGGGPGCISRLNLLGVGGVADFP